MTEDLTLEDLAGLSGAEEASAEAASEAAQEATEQVAEQAAEQGVPPSEFVLDLVDRLEDRGLLTPLLFGPDGAQELQEAQPSASPASSPGGGQGAELGAEQVAKVGKQVIDQVGDVKISKLVLLAEQKPEMVNALIEEHLE